MNPKGLKGKRIYSKHSNKTQGNNNYGGEGKLKVTSKKTDHGMTEHGNYAEKRDSKKNCGKITPIN